MLIIKRSVIRHLFQTLTAPYSNLRYKHTLVWHVMQSNCAEQQSVELSRLRFFLSEGERVNRMTLLYTAVPSNLKKQNRFGFKYVLSSGLHVTLEDLRTAGRIPHVIKSTEYLPLPQSLSVKQQHSLSKLSTWENSVWTSRQQLAQKRTSLLEMANRLMLRRGVQSDLGEMFANTLQQIQSPRLQSRLENYHPQGNKLLSLQQSFVRRYAKLFSHEQNFYGFPLFRERVLPGLQRFRRIRRRRLAKLRSTLGNRGFSEFRPRLTTSLYLENGAVNFRPQNVPFLNVLSLVSRQVLRSAWRRRRGFGILNRTFRKTGRLVWDLPACDLTWPVRSLPTLTEEKTAYGLLPTVGVVSVVGAHAENKTSLQVEDRFLRAFPFLFQSAGLNLNNQ